MMLVKKCPSIINMTIKIDKASLGAASDAGDVQGLHKGRLGIGQKTVEGPAVKISTVDSYVTVGSYGLT